jgi:XTP/dITP diphosphohydrolase
LKLVLATTNPGKRRELQALLAPLGMQLLLQSELGIDSVEETGASFEANALLKARYVSLRSGLPALADDSGLEVDALGGRPGVHSARYAGVGASDAQNNALLLRELAAAGALEPAQRRARYCCVLALQPQVREAPPLLAQGRWEGRIALQGAGSGGFGYDCLFIPDGYEQTAAEMPPGLKNRLSHRAQALQALHARLLADGPRPP